MNGIILNEADEFIDEDDGEIENASGIDQKVHI